MRAAGRQARPPARSRMPSCDSEIPSSFSESTIPADSTPRIFAFFRTVGFPGAPIDKPGAFGGERDLLPGRDVGSAADDAPIIVIAEVHRDERQPLHLRVGVRLHLDHLRDADAVPVAAAEMISPTSTPAVVRRRASSSLGRVKST